MKKIVIILLVCLLVLCGCKQEVEFEKPANLYYVNTDYSGTESVTLFSVEQVESKNLYTINILRQYFRRTTGEMSHSPFPSGLQVVRVEHVSDTLYVTLSRGYLSLTGLDLTLANACLYKTCTELTGATKVQIIIDGALPEETSTILLSPEDFFLEDYTSEQ